MITSYAQNFEDVLLWRALSHVTKGLYIDVGAHHPIVDSVSKLFYDQGWRGIHVEPIPLYAALLREHRADETVLEAAAADRGGTLIFYAIAETGLSTAVRSIATRHQERGYSVREILVPCMTLADIFAQTAENEIHWLKIDVEGLEERVLRGWSRSPKRPWVVVVESTKPLSQTETHQKWEHLLLRRGYRQVHFDGLNRYFISKNHPELAHSLRVGPNVFDGFTLSGTSSASFCAALNEKLEAAQTSKCDELERLRKVSAEFEEEAHRNEQRLADHLRTAEDDLKQLTAELLEAKRRAVEDKQHLLNQFEAERAEFLEKEEAHYTSLRNITDRMAQDAEGFRNSRRYDLDRLKEAEERRKSAEERVTALQQSLVERERAFSDQLLKLRSDFELAAEVANRTSTEREKSLLSQLLARDEERIFQQKDFVAREAVLTQKLTVVQRDFEALARSQASREHDLANHLAEEQEKHEKARDEERIRQHKDSVARETVLTQKLTAMQRDFEALLLQSVVRREEIFLRRIDADRQRHDTVLANLVASFTEQKNTILEEQTQARRELASHVTALQEDIATLRAGNEAKVEELTRQVMALKLEAVDLSDREVARETELARQLDGERQAIATLRSVVINYQVALNKVRLSLVWRILSFLRLVPTVSSQNVLSQDPAGHFPRFASTSGLSTTTLSPSQMPTSEATIHPMAPQSAHQLSDGPVALGDLLALHDVHFLRAAYRSVLCRDPDPTGLAYYLPRLRGGVSKIRVLADLRLSPEGRSCSPHVRGLDRAIRYHRIGHLPLLSWLLRATGTEGNGPLERKLRSVENRLLLLADSHDRRLDEIQERLQALYTLIERAVNAESRRSASDEIHGSAITPPRLQSSGSSESECSETSSLRSLLDRRINEWRK